MQPLQITSEDADTVVDAAALTEARWPSPTDVQFMSTARGLRLPRQSAARQRGSVWRLMVPGLFAFALGAALALLLTRGHHG